MNPCYIGCYKSELDVLGLRCVAVTHFGPGSVTRELVS
jgi:hypothetical protein